MIWAIALHILRFLGKCVLFVLVPPPKGRFSRKSPLPVLDVDAPCPGCGHTSGTISCVIGDDPTTLKIRHTCNVCGGRWHDPTVVDANTKQLWPADNVNHYLAHEYDIEPVSK